MHNNFFEEIAKFRAARRLWARIMRERFGAKDPKRRDASLPLANRRLDPHGAAARQQRRARHHAGAGRRPRRHAVAAHQLARTKRSPYPPRTAAKLALRTQQVVAYESGVADTVDPLAGSYFVETLTDEIQRRAEEYLERIDKMGGAVRAIEAGFQAREIHNAAYRFQQDVEKKREIVVGVNDFTEETEAPTEILRIDPKLEEEQRVRVRAVRSRRDAKRAAAALEALDRAAGAADNLMPFIVEAVRSYVTLGEVSDVLRRRFDEYRPQMAV